MSSANKEMIQSTCHAAAYGLLLLEVLVNIVVIHRVKYTEIDWIAYMQARPRGFFQSKNRKYIFTAQQKGFIAVKQNLSLSVFKVPNNYSTVFVPLHTC
jgi:hypothetical protein